MRKVDYSAIPDTDTKNYSLTKTYSTTKDLENSVGCKLPFVFDDIEGVMTVEDYLMVTDKNGCDRYYLRVAYNGNSCLYNAYNVFIGNIKRLVTEDIEFKYNTGDVYGIFTITGHKIREKILPDGRVDSRKVYLMECMECGHEVHLREDHITSGHIRVDTCSGCKDLKNKKKKASIKRSKGEAIVEEVLKQKGIKYQAEKTFPWSSRKRYDFYLPELNTVIEVHGIQHYEEQNDGSIFRNNLEKQKEVDRYKKHIATYNGLSYIEINASTGNLEDIKDSLEKSSLDVDGVNWSDVYINVDGSGSLDTIISMYNDGALLKDLMEATGRSSRAIKRMLNTAFQLGLIDFYDSYELNYRRLSRELKEIEDARRNNGEG